MKGSWARRPGPDTCENLHAGLADRGSLEGPMPTRSGIKIPVLVPSTWDVYVGILQTGGMTSSSSLGGRRFDAVYGNHRIDHANIPARYLDAKPCSVAWQASLDKLLTGQYRLPLANLVCLPTHQWSSGELRIP